MTKGRSGGTPLHRAHRKVSDAGRCLLAALDQRDGPEVQRAIGDLRSALQVLDGVLAERYAARLEARGRNLNTQRGQP